MLLLGDFICSAWVSSLRFLSLRSVCFSIWSIFDFLRSSISFYFSTISFLYLDIWLTTSLSFFFTLRSSAPIFPEWIFESNSFWFFYSISFTYFLFSICSWWKSMNFSSSPISCFFVIWLLVFMIWVARVCFLFLYFSISPFFWRSFSSKNFYILSASIFPVRLFSPPIKIYLWKS